MFNDCEGAKSKWNYHAVETAKEALEGADFVIISIMPATLDEMHSDVHTPEKYGIYQPVGDTSGPGGIVRAMRCVPMYEKIKVYNLVISFIENAFKTKVLLGWRLMDMLILDIMY